MRRANFANAAASGRNICSTVCSSWSWYKRLIHSMSTAVMHCFILLKSGHYETIVCHYALSTLFEIGSGLATGGRYNGDSCERFDEIWRGILMKTWSLNLFGIGMTGRTMNKTLIQRTNVILSGDKVHKSFNSNLLKALIEILKPFCHIFVKKHLKYW